MISAFLRSLDPFTLVTLVLRSLLGDAANGAIESLRVVWHGRTVNERLVAAVDLGAAIAAITPTVIDDILFELLEELTSGKIYKIAMKLVDRIRGREDVDEEAPAELKVLAKYSAEYLPDMRRKTAAGEVLPSYSQLASRAVAAVETAPKAVDPRLILVIADAVFRLAELIRRWRTGRNPAAA